MKTLFLLILSLSFTLTTLGQQLTKGQVDSLLNGTWKADSSNTVLKFDCHRKDTIVAYGILSQRNIDWYISFMLSEKCHDFGYCNVPDSGTYYMLEINYSNDPRMIARVGYTYKILSLSEKRLALYKILGKITDYKDGCQLLTYTKVK